MRREREIGGGKWGFSPFSSSLASVPARKREKGGGNREEGKENEKKKKRGILYVYPSSQIEN